MLPILLIINQVLSFFYHIHSSSNPPYTLSIFHPIYNPIYLSIHPIYHPIYPSSLYIPIPTPTHTTDARSYKSALLRPIAFIISTLKLFPPPLLQISLHPTTHYTHTTHPDPCLETRPTCPPGVAYHPGYPVHLPTTINSTRSCPFILTPAPSPMSGDTPDMSTWYCVPSRLSITLPYLPIHTNPRTQPHVWRHAGHVIHATSGAESSPGCPVRLRLGREGSRGILGVLRRMRRRPTGRRRRRLLPTRQGCESSR